MSSGKRGEGRSGAHDAEEKLPRAGGDAAALALIREAEGLAEEAGANRRRAEELTRQVAALWKELDHVAGSETLRAIRAGEEGIDALLARRDLLAAQRDALLVHTDDLLRRCETRSGREQAVLDWGFPVLDAVLNYPAKGSTVAALRQGMFARVEKARKQTEKAREDLLAARLLLADLRVDRYSRDQGLSGRVGLRPNGLG